MASTDLRYEIKVDGAAKAESQIKGIGGQVSSLAKTLGLAAVAAVAFRKAITLAKQVQQNYEAQIIATRQLQATLNSTGRAAEFTTKQLGDLATELQKISNFGDDEIMQEATASLLRFDAISRDIFPRAQRLTIDLAESMGGIGNAARTLGISLADPTLGLTRLRRVGVAFSKDQEAMIKNFVETGQVVKAQEILLTALESKYKGLASASISATKQMQNAWGDYLETFGSTMSFVDGIKRGITMALLDIANTTDITSASAQLASLETQESWGKAIIQIINYAKMALTGLGGFVVGVGTAFITSAKMVTNSVNMLFQALRYSAMTSIIFITQQIIRPFQAILDGIDLVRSKLGQTDLGLGDTFKPMMASLNAARGDLKDEAAKFSKDADVIASLWGGWWDNVSSIWGNTQHSIDVQTDMLIESIEAQRNAIKSAVAGGIDTGSEDNAAVNISTSLDTAAIENYYARMMHLNASSAQEVIDSHNEMRDSLWQYLEATVTDLKLRDDMYATAEAEIAAAQKARLTEIRQNEIDAERKLAAEMLGIKVAALQDLEGYQSEYLALRFQQIDAETEKLRQAGLDQVTIAAWVASERARAQSEANPEIETKLTEMQEIYAAAGRNIRTSLEGTIGNALHGLMTTQQNFADAMRDLWKNLANSVIAEISRMIAKMLILKIISTLTGVPMGGSGGMGLGDSGVMGTGSGGGGIFGGIFGTNQVTGGSQTQSFAPIAQTQNSLLANRIDRLIVAIENNQPQIYTQKIEGIPFYNAIRRAEMVTNEL